MNEPDPCALTITWADRTIPATLNHPWVRNVLSIRGISGKQPDLLMLAFGAGAYTIDDVERVLELGLIGAGMPEREVEQLLDAHVRRRPIGENARSAADLLAALYFGKPVNVDASA